MEKNIVKYQQKTCLNLSVIGPFYSGKTSICGYLYKFLSEEENEDTYLENTIHNARLYGLDPYKSLFDKMEIEKKRGLTIESTEVEIRGKNCNIKITDTPGHPKFIKNMIRGISLIQSSLIVFSVLNESKLGMDDDKILELQLLIATNMGVNQFIVLINKMDRVNFSQKRFDNAKSKVQQVFEKLGLVDKIIEYIPVSAIYGDNIIIKSSNISWYIGDSLSNIIIKTTLHQSNEKNGPLILPIKSIFPQLGEIKVTGKIISGTIRLNETLINANFPNEKQIVVSKLEVSGKSLNEYSSNGEVSFNIQSKPRYIERGHVFLSQILKTPKITRKIKAKLNMKRFLELKPHKGFTFFSHMTHSVAFFEKCLLLLDEKDKVLEENPQNVKPGDTVLAILNLKFPIVVDNHSNYSNLGNILLINNHIVHAVGKIEEMY